MMFYVIIVIVIVFVLLGFALARMGRDGEGE